jgi:putative membrane protein
MTKYHKLLALVFLAVWVWAAINPTYRHDWLLENYLVFIFVPAIILTGRYFRLSSISYGLITLFMILHVIGSHYTYAEVPFGYVLQEWLGASRNMYDRLVHFSFGLLLAYPIREVFMRVSRVKGIWAYYLPLDVTLSFSAVYEIIEWVTAIKAAPEAASRSSARRATCGTRKKIC